MSRSLRICGLLACVIAVHACSGSPQSDPTPPAAPTPPLPTPAPGPASPAAQDMLAGLQTHIAWALQQNQELLPRNAHLASQLQSKIALLQRPTLASEITSGGFYVESAATSTNGRRVPIVAVFPQESMRSEASQAVREIESALPMLESFMAIPFPTNFVRIWYGFIIGNSGGGGTLNMEDRGTYDARRTGSMVLYDAILDHELSHSYIGHEGLTQFLELFVYNMIRTGSTNVQSWGFVRDYVASRATNTGVHALLDVYQMIGRDAMANAYRAVYPLRPPYGQTLSSECQQVFVNQSPAAVRTQVAEKMAKVGF